MYMPGSKDPSHYTISRWTGVVSGQRLDWTKVRTQGGIRTKVITRGGIRTKVRTNENSLGVIIFNKKKNQHEHPFIGSN
jgi:exosome complex RNA-binding protein Csl4